MKNMIITEITIVVAQGGRGTYTKIAHAILRETWWTRYYISTPLRLQRVQRMQVAYLAR